ncbi:MAG TPA: hypothetical protein VM848_05355 [Acidimicrobiia bacterium]|nr:hypothetical protein [Acidimicrobiia bacterium]
MTAPSPHAQHDPLAPTAHRMGPPPFLLGLVMAVVALGFLGPVLESTDWNPTILAAFGVEAPASLEYAEGLLGEVHPRAGLGHDGKFFFAQAIDPWLSDRATLEAVIDLPIYRAQRMFYPMLAGVFGLAPPGVVVWMLVLVNVAAFGFGTWVTALVARGMGASSMWGLAFPVNLGVWSELLVSGAGVVALAASLAAVAALQRGSLVGGMAALSLSALSREVMLLCAFGIAVWMWRKNAKRAAVYLLTTPVAVTIGWALYVRSRLGWTAGTDQVSVIGWPFQGLAGAIDSWLGSPIDLAVGLVVLVLLVVFTVRSLTRDRLVGWMALGFVPLAFVLTELVWTDFFDITRAVAPVITAFVLVSFAGDRGSDEITANLARGTDGSVPSYRLTRRPWRGR